MDEIEARALIALKCRNGRFSVMRPSFPKGLPVTLRIPSERKSEVTLPETANSGGVRIRSANCAQHLCSAVACPQAAEPHGLSLLGRSIPFFFVRVRCVTARLRASNMLMRGSSVSQILRVGGHHGLISGNRVAR